MVLAKIKDWQSLKVIYKMPKLSSVCPQVAALATLVCTGWEGPAQSLYIWVCRLSTVQLSKAMTADSWTPSPPAAPSFEGSNTG